MALIKCPECGKEVSDKAPACIHCGFPLNNIQPSKNENIYYNIDILIFIKDVSSNIFIIPPFMQLIMNAVASFQLSLLV